jgi:vancomycin aglycone glucosyltransferase
LASLFDSVNLRHVINTHRRNMGLRPIHDAWQHVLGPRCIVASDAAIAQVPTDCIPEAVQTGYVHLPQSDPSSRSLSEFLAAGEPPVYAGFGSMPKQDQIRALLILVKAARATGQRTVIARFWDEPSPFDRAPDICWIRKYPHLHLFHQMAAIIHHGGAGTTAAAAICGRPQIIVPHILDQNYWGRRIEEAGLGPKPIPRSGLTLPKLSSAIGRCISNTVMQKKAAEIGDIIRKADGLSWTIAELLNASSAGKVTMPAQLAG